MRKFDDSKQSCPKSYISYQYFLFKNQSEDSPLIFRMRAPLLTVRSRAGLRNHWEVISTVWALVSTPVEQTEELSRVWDLTWNSPVGMAVSSQSVQCKEETDRLPIWTWCWKPCGLTYKARALHTHLAQTFSWGQTMARIFLNGLVFLHDIWHGNIETNCVLIGGLKR